MTPRLRIAVGWTAFLALCLLAPAASIAQGGAGEQPNPACTSRPDCRYVGTVTIHTDQGDKTPTLNRNMPYLRTNNGHERLWLVIGERVDLRLGHDGEPPLVVVGHGLATDPPKSKEELKDKIEVEFKQLDKSTYTMMEVYNGYGRALQYKAFMLSQHGDERPTSACAVLPGIVSMENWPGPLVEIELADFQLIDGSPTQVTCK